MSLNGGGAMMLRRTIAVHVDELHRVEDLVRRAVRDERIPDDELVESALAARCGAPEGLVGEACARLVREGLLVRTCRGRWARPPTGGSARTPVARRTRA
jgi:DNA-binding GntR family transcriptional regulator